MKQKVVKAYIHDSDVLMLPQGHDKEFLEDWIRDELIKQGVDPDKPFDWTYSPVMKRTNYVQLQPVTA